MMTKKSDDSQTATIAAIAATSKNPFGTALKIALGIALAQFLVIAAVITVISVSYYLVFK